MLLAASGRASFGRSLARATVRAGVRTAAGRARTVLSVLFAALFAAATLPATGHASTSIRLVVNNEPITNYDIAQRARLMRLTGVSGNPTRAAEEELINETIQMQEAARRGVRVADRDVEAAIGQIAGRIGISVSQLYGALRQQGVNPDTLKDRIRAQIAWGRVIQARFNAIPPISEQELVAALREKGGEEGKETYEYTLEQVIAVVPGGATAAARRRANDLRRRFSGCEQGLQLARETREVVVRPFGRRLETEMSPELVEALQGVPVGGLTAPIERQEGLVMFAVCDKKQVRSTAAAMHELEKDMRPERGEQFAKQYLRTLRRDALVERR